MAGVQSLERYVCALLRPVRSIARLTSLELESVAYNASQYLLALLSTSQVALKPSEVLDKIYTSAHPSSPSADPAELLLTLESVPLISKAFNFNEDDATALRRSVTQAKQRLEKELATSQPSEVETNDKEEKSS